MCTSLANGGRRCAAHTRIDYEKALRVVEAGRNPGTLLTLIGAAEEHAGTPAGAKEILEQINHTADPLIRGILEDAHARAQEHDFVITRDGVSMPAELKAAPLPEEEVDWEALDVNASYPFPQANSLTKIAVALDAVNSGADTDDGIAEALGVSERQGAYYATAAGYLGLIESSGDSPRVWSLTNAGASFLNVDADMRADILATIVDRIPVTVEDNEDLILSDVLDADSAINNTTAERRAATLATWRKTLSNLETATEQLKLETDGLRSRIESAAKRSKATRTRVRKKSAPAAPLDVCQKCFTVKAASGTCLC